MTLRLPKPLRRGGTIGIVAPASPQRDPSRLARGIAYLEGLGYTVVCAKNLHAVHGSYLAGTDQQRADDLHAMFADKRVDAIFCARGGYGSARLLDLLDYRLIRRNPKILLGFSDITALQLALLRKTGLVTFSGVMPSVEMADGMRAETEEWFWRTMTSTKPLGTVRQPWPLTVLKNGSASGQLLAGNLSIITSLIGTPYMPSVKGAVLTVEDVAEETYRVDRMLNQLRLAGCLDALAATVFGQWSQGQQAPGRTTPTRNIHEVLTEVADVSTGPVLSNLMYGHEPSKLTLPVGVSCKVSSRYGLQLTGAALQA